MVPLLYWHHRQHAVEQQLHRMVADETDAAVAGVQTQLRTFELVLRGVKGFFEGSDQVDPAEFKAFIASLALERTAPGLQGVGFVAHLSDGPGPPHAAATAFARSGLAVRPQGPRLTYAPILFMEPPARNNAAALGLDVLTVPAAREAIERASATGAPALTAKLQLAQDAGGVVEVGFVMFLPVYMPQPGAREVGAAGAVPAGWADAPFRLRELLAPAAAELMPGLRLHVFDGGAPTEASHLFGLLDGQPTAFDSAVRSAYAVQRTATFGGRTWTYLLEPTSGFIATHRTQDHHALAAAGVLLSLSAGALVFLLLGARARATLALREGERVLLEAQRVASLGHFWVDRHARVCRLSRACVRLLGMLDTDVLGIDDFLGCVDVRQRARVEALCLADASPEAVEYEFRILRVDDGRPRWMLLSAPSADGTDGERFFTLQDISSRRASQDQLKLLQSAVESLNDAVLITEAEPFEEPGPPIVFVNEAFVRQTGYTRAEVLGRSPRFLHGPRTERAELARIGAAMRRRELVRAELVHYTRQGAPYWLELVVQPITDANGWHTHWVAVERNIGERREAQAQVHRMAYFDQLTGLPNRSLFVKEATQVLESAIAQGVFGAAILIDLDKFKAINDNWGHRSGDALLREVAQRLRNCVAAGHLVARLHADEFIVLLRCEVQTEDAAAQAAQGQCRAVLRVLAAPVPVGEREHYTSASMGIAVFGREALTLEELLGRADSAMELAKQGGRNTFKFFDEGLRSRLAERATLEAALRHAVQRDQLTLLYQPQIDACGAVVGAEALCRWTHPERGPVSPAVFITLAEDNGSIYALGEWVLRTACRTLASWRPGTPMGSVVMAVNVSARQFHHPDFVGQVLGALQGAGAEPTRLKLELTESVVAHDLDAIVTKMGALKAVGVRFSLDDFGTGYSSLSYLKRLPLDQLKIDQSFVRDLLTNANDAAIVRTVIALGDSLGLRVVAEGVETVEQRDVLHAAGCHIFQGYLFARPLPAEQLLAFAARQEA